MNERDELLERITKVNPVPSDTELPDSVADSRPPLGLLISEGHTPENGGQPRRVGHADRRWRGPVLALGTAVALFAVFAAAILLIRGDRFDASEEPSPTTQASPETTTTSATVPSTATTTPDVADAAVSTTTAVSSTTTVAAAPNPVVPDVWTAILATTNAGEPPTAASCSPSTNPDDPGPTDQPRPRGAIWSNQAAVFDQHAGKVLFVAEQGDLWAFDVCANTWHELNPSPMPGESMLVYDVDSDVTLGFNDALVWVYNANTNTATTRPMPVEFVLPPPGFGAVYDPVSGLVVLQTYTTGLVAYDVDSDTWTPIGQIADDDAYPPYLVGYVAESDQLVFLESSQQTSGSLLVDPRTGESVAITGPEGGVFAGFGRMSYAVGSDSPFVENWHLDPTTLEWNRISVDDGPRQSGLLAAIVGDPINDRVVWINGYGPGFNGARFYDVNDIWGIDPTNNEWTHLLERSSGRTYEAYAWVNPAPFGIEVELSPSTLPSIPGEYGIEIDVSQSEPWTLPWACPRLAGAVEPDLSTDTIDEVCTPLVADVSQTVEYPTVVTVTVTDDIIRAGALTIAVNATMGDWAGTALLPIDD